MAQGQKEESTGVSTTRKGICHARLETFFHTGTVVYGHTRSRAWTHTYVRTHRHTHTNNNNNNNNNNNALLVESLSNKHPREIRLVSKSDLPACLCFLMLGLKSMQAHLA